jgi:hypothetical protein
MKTIKVCFFNIAFMCLIGCASSSIYSPSIGLSNKRLEKKQVDIQGGFEMMPETRPHALYENGNSTLALCGQMGFGLGNNFNFYLKGWVGAENILDRYGASIAGQFINQTESGGMLIILPRIGFAADGPWIHGFAFGSSVIYQQKIIESMSYYAGGGLYAGFQDFEKKLNDKNAYKLPMGWAVICNLGLAWDFANNLRLNFELNPVLQINTFDEKKNLMLSPHLGIGYSFRGKEKHNSVPDGNMR